MVDYVTREGGMGGMGDLVYKNNNDNNNSTILGGTAAHCRSYRRSHVCNKLEGEEMINEHSRDFLSYKVFNWLPQSIF